MNTTRLLCPVLMLLWLSCRHDANSQLNKNPAYSPTFKYQSITLAAWGGTHFYDSDSNGLANIDSIAATGANYITLQIISTLPSTSASSFPSALDDAGIYADIKKAALYAKTKGLKITLKPHIEVAGGGVLQTVQYSPANGDTFFACVEHDLLNNITLAKEIGAEMLIVGTELGGKITSNHGDYGYDNCTAWHKIITEIRAAAPGLTLTYAATMTNTWNYLEANEATRLCFWDALDYIGLDAYPDMNNISPQATAADFYNRMFNNGNPVLNGGDDGTANSLFSLNNFTNQYGLINQSQIKYIDFVCKGIRTITNKPNMRVIITEIGTPSTNDALAYWGSLNSEVINYTAQANGWDGVMAALATEDSVINGINIWSVSPWHSPNDTTNQTWKKDWDPIGKPAYTIIKNGLGAARHINHYCIPSQYYKSHLFGGFYSIVRVC